MSETTKKKKNKLPEEENNTVGATESRLLQAMSMFEEQKSDEQVQPLQNFIAYAGDSLKDSQAKAKMFDIVEAIKTVSDPEIPINVYDMGLIYKIDQRDNGDLSIDMTLTAPTCPIAGVLPQQVADAAASVDGVGKVEVKLIWEPAWTPDKMTEEAKVMLELI